LFHANQSFKFLDLTPFNGTAETQEFSSAFLQRWASPQLQLAPWHLFIRHVEGNLGWNL
jgi:hypothetical protein